MKNYFISLLLYFSFNYAWGDVCIDKATKILAGVDTKKLNFIGEIVNQYIPKEKMTHLNPEEKIFLKNNPHALLAIRNSACRSMALTYSLCGLESEDSNLIGKTNDEETDALRHFIYTAYLSCSHGIHFAKIYSTLHEGPIKNWGERERMDFHNNMQAIEWADPKYNRCALPMTDERMAYAALEQLASGKLKTIKKGDTLCTDPKKLLKSNPAENLKNIPKFYPLIKSWGVNC